MKTWLAEPITRAEAIGWQLTIPACIYVAIVGHGSVEFFQSVQWTTRGHTDLTPPLFEPFAAAGGLGIALAFLVLTLLPLAAQIFRQRAWVRLVAPVVCVLLASQGSALLLRSGLDYMGITETVLSAKAAELTRK
ncbi:MAG: hypothetical protein ACT4PU_08390 [Planctomycetota bacterium]